MPRFRGTLKRKRIDNKAPPKPGAPVCAPSIASTRRNSKSCLPKSVLTKLTNSKKLCIRKGRDPKPILAEEFGCKSSNERCIIQKSSLSSEKKRKLLATYFRPVMPEVWLKKPTMWLNSDDISNVMKQYETAYPNFRFIGVVPNDFSAPDPTAKAAGETRCLNQEFCTIQLKDELAKGKTFLGAIFNLDPHDKPGSHWVALMIDLKKHVICYFDSTGYPPTNQVEHFMRYFTLQDPTLRLQINGRRFQHGNTECGMYSMYFLIRMMEGTSFKQFCKHPISDKWMVEFRKILFDSSVYNSK
jgi:hypothetical protein